ESVTEHETLAAIQHQLEPMRTAMSTLRYGDRLSNAPGSRQPSNAPKIKRKAEPLTSAPEIVVGETSMGRDTMAAITSELIPSSGPRASIPDKQSEEQPSAPVHPAEKPVPFAIFEMMTFVVQGSEATQLSSKTLRRRFVERYLLQQL